MLVILWAFDVAGENTTEFERVYGPAGEWAHFFRRGSGYLGTELWRDAHATGRYLTIDRWESAEAFERFKAKFAGEYAELDRQCEVLTLTERPIGQFDSLDAIGLMSGPEDLHA